MLRKIGQYLRISEWFDSKIPFLISCIWYINIIEDRINVERTVLYRQTAGAFFFSCFFLAFGYLINDYYDMDADRLAGKDKLIHHMNVRVVRLSLIVIVAVGIVSAVSADAKLYPGTFLTACLTYFIGAVYSMPPFRFKERGVQGLFVSAFAQRCMPLIVFKEILHCGWIPIIPFIILSFATGLRYIFIHQVMDADNDRKSGIHTFAMKHEQISRAGIWCCFFTEIILFLFILLRLNNKTAWVLTLITLLLECVECRTVSKYMMRKVFYTFYCVPLEGYENIVFPLLLTGILISRSRITPAVLVLEMFILIRPAYRKLSLVGVFCRESVRELASNRKG